MMTSLFFPYILQIDKCLYFLSLTADHCEIWYLRTNFVGSLSYCIENGKKRYSSSNVDVVNLKAMIKVHTQFCFTGTMACLYET